MEYLTIDQLKKLTPQRRLALLRKVQALVGCYIHSWYDFMPEQLDEFQTKLNEYRKLIYGLVWKDRSNRTMLSNKANVTVQKERYHNDRVRMAVVHPHN